MFNVHRTLEVGDFINVIGTMNNDPKLLVAGLLTGDTKPDYSNVACQVEAVFPNKFTVKCTKNGTDKIVEESELSSNVSTRIKEKFLFKFIFNKDYLIVKCGEGDLEHVKLEHDLDKIKFISIRGDYKEVVSLQFGRMDSEELISQELGQTN